MIDRLPFPQIGEIGTLLDECPTEGERSRAVALLEEAVTRWKSAADCEPTRLTCSVCGVSFKKTQFYERHVRGHAKNTCGSCGLSFTRRRALVLHMREEHKVLDCLVERRVGLQ